MILEILVSLSHLTKLPKWCLKMPLIKEGVKHVYFRSPSDPGVHQESHITFLGEANIKTHFSVGPKELCALARLGCTRAAGTS